LAREVSDHTPLLLDTGNGTHGNKQPAFKFELGWLLREDFSELVVGIWRKEQRGTTPLQPWQCKIQRLRQFLSGWAKDVSSKYKKEKAELIRKADMLDKKAEVQPLSCMEIDLKNFYKERLALLLWNRKSSGTKEPRQLGCYLVIAILSIFTSWLMVNIERLESSA
jgi:hypothetical protein